MNILYLYDQHIHQNMLLNLIKNTHAFIRFQEKTENIDESR